MKVETAVVDWERIQSRIETAGWRTHPRTSGLVVDLESDHDFFQASLYPAQQTLACRVKIAEAKIRTVSLASQKALCFLAVSANRSLRLVQAFFGARGTRLVFGLEKRLPPPVDIEALPDILAAF